MSSGTFAPMFTPHLVFALPWAVCLGVAGVQQGVMRRARNPFPRWALWTARAGAFGLPVLWASAAWWNVLGPVWLPLNAGVAVLAVIGFARGVGVLKARPVRSEARDFAEEQLLERSLAQLNRNEELFERQRTLRSRNLRAQMNPHFLFNVLTGIQHLLMENKVEQAGNVFRKFREHLVHGLREHERIAGTVQEELDHVRAYLELEELRLDRPFTWSVTVGTGVDAAETPCPLFVLQPLVENALWHGISGVEDRTGEIAITVRWLGDDLLLQVHDNGKGLQPAVRGSSRGTSMLRERLALLESSASLTLGPPGADSPFAVGTSAIVRLPGWRSAPRPQKGNRGSEPSDQGDGSAGG